MNKSLVEKDVAIPSDGWASRFKKIKAQPTTLLIRFEFPSHFS